MRKGRKGSLLLRNDTNGENMSDNSQVAELALLHVVQACVNHTGDKNSNEIIQMMRSWAGNSI